MENRIQYRGNGEVTEFFYNFVIFAAGDMEVYLDDALQVSGYEVVGAGDKEGGKVVFEKAPASGVLVTLSRKLEISRRSDMAILLIMTNLLTMNLIILWPVCNKSVRRLIGR